MSVLIYIQWLAFIMTEFLAMKEALLCIKRLV